ERGADRPDARDQEHDAGNAGEAAAQWFEHVERGGPGAVAGEQVAGEVRQGRGDEEEEAADLGGDEEVGEAAGQAWGRREPGDGPQERDPNVPAGGREQEAKDRERQYPVDERWRVEVGVPRSEQLGESESGEEEAQ